MKRIKLLNGLIDIFFKLFILGVLIAAGIMIADAFSDQPSINYDVDTRHFMFWVFAVVEIIEWILFLGGIYFLRKVARNLLLNQPFSEAIIDNLMKSGKSILTVGILQIVNAIGTTLYELIIDASSLSLSMESLLPISFIIIGLFFIIQSSALLIAKNNKEELELVV